jgi:hypothetical protein
MIIFSLHTIILSRLNKKEALCPSRVKDAPVLKNKALFESISALKKGNLVPKKYKNPKTIWGSFPVDLFVNKTIPYLILLSRQFLTGLLLNYLPGTLSNLVFFFRIKKIKYMARLIIKKATQELCTLSIFLSKRLVTISKKKNVATIEKKRRELSPESRLE